MADEEQGKKRRRRNGEQYGKKGQRRAGEHGPQQPEDWTRKGVYGRSLVLVEHLREERAEYERGTGRENTYNGFTGRQRELEADALTFGQLFMIAAAQHTKEEAAAMMGVGYSTLVKFFEANPQASEAWEDGKQNGRASLRRTQFNHALSSVPMAIHLGKIYLGQNEAEKPQDVGELIDQAAAELDFNVSEFLTRVRSKRNSPSPPQGGESQA